MITLILIIVGIYFFFTSYIFRFSLAHIPLVFKNVSKDLFHYFKYKQWREMKTYGTMNIYVADETQPFGSGKTLNMVYQAYNIYRQYDDVDVFNIRAGAWVKQYVHIYSNVKLLGIPYVPLTSTYQLIDVATNDIYKDDNIHIFVFLIDELGRIFNNRDWKTNLNKDMLGALLQQRKNHLCILGTVQDFSLFDATMRKVCSNVYSCSKKWRYLLLRQYYAVDLERANFNADLVKMRGAFVRFATDALYNSYDTYEIVEDLQKEIESGQHLSNEEILNASENGLDIRSLTRVGKRFKGHVRG